MSTNLPRSVLHQYTSAIRNPTQHVKSNTPSDKQKVARNSGNPPVSISLYFAMINNNNNDNNNTTPFAMEEKLRRFLFFFLFPFSYLFYLSIYFTPRPSLFLSNAYIQHKSCMYVNKVRKKKRKKERKKVRTNQ